MYANAGFWAIGNGLLGTTLIIYLVIERGAVGMGVSCVLAAPRLAGILRLAVPAMVARLQSRKLFCIACFTASCLVLGALLLFAIPGIVTASDQLSLIGIVSTWALYHLLEYFGVVALWSWLGDLLPERIRGRLIGRRERWLVVGRIVGLAISGSLYFLMARFAPDQPRWVPLVCSASAGVLFMLLSIVPLWRLPAMQQTASALPQLPWQMIGEVFTNRAYRRLLMFSCWFGVANGITNSAQYLYSTQVLGIQYYGMLALSGTLRSGQAVIAPWCGALVDRFGSKRVMFIAQLIVATGPLFFWLASPERWWVVIGAYLVWIAYAGLNIGLDNIKLEIASAENNLPYLAVYHAISDLANAVAVLGSGFWFDQLRNGGASVLPLYALFFIVGWIGRTLSVVFIARLIEKSR